MNLNALVAIEHPSRKHVRLSQTVHKGAEANTLNHSANTNGAGSGHHDLQATTQLWPCKPTWITLPSSTRTGTVWMQPSSEWRRSRATESASMSYSRKSRRLHSSDSRNSCV